MTTTPNPLAHGHRDDYSLLANARRLLTGRNLRLANWALAMDLFATGSTSAMKICRDAGIDPYSIKTERVTQALEKA